MLALCLLPCQFVSFTGAVLVHRSIDDSPVEYAMASEHHSGICAPLLTTERQARTLADLVEFGVAVRVTGEWVEVERRRVVKVRSVEALGGIP